MRRTRRAWYSTSYSSAPRSHVANSAARSLTPKRPQPGTGLASKLPRPSAGEVWRNAPGPVADRSQMSGGRGITKQPRTSIVARLLDNSTKKSKTLDLFGNTVNDLEGG